MTAAFRCAVIGLALVALMLAVVLTSGSGPHTQALPIDYGTPTPATPPAGTIPTAVP